MHADGAEVKAARKTQAGQAPSNRRRAERAVLQAAILAARMGNWLTIADATARKSANHPGTPAPTAKTERNRLDRPIATTISPLAESDADRRPTSSDTAGAARFARSRSCSSAPDSPSKVTTKPCWKLLAAVLPLPLSVAAPLVVPAT